MRIQVCFVGHTAETCDCEVFDLAVTDTDTDLDTDTDTDSDTDTDYDTKYEDGWYPGCDF